MMISRNFDSRDSIEVALFSIEDELNSRGLFPVSAPKLLVEVKEHKVFCDNDGNAISCYCGVVTQFVRSRKDEEGVLKIHYAIHPFGLASIENVPISFALEKIEAEIKKEKGILIGEIQIMNQYECKSDDWTTFGGLLVQPYSINPLTNAFK